MLQNCNSQILLQLTTCCVPCWYHVLCTVYTTCWYLELCAAALRKAAQYIVFLLFFFKKELI